MEVSVDYEFSRNSFDDSYRIVFSMGHEAIGRWLLDELGTELTQVTSCLHTLQQLESEQQWRGHTFTLTANRDEVVVVANAMLQPASDEAQTTLNEQALTFYDEESYAACGYQDFVVMLDAYQDFIVRYGRR
nr:MULTISPECIES: YacL family protein [unclassified Salinivibrio]